MGSILEVVDTGKSYYRSWLFRGVSISFTLEPGNSFVILGNNGSGKSTFLLLLAGQITPSEGTINWRISDNEIPDNEKHLYYSLASPGLELLEELSLQEWFDFHNKTKPFQKGVTLDYIAELCDFNLKTLSKPMANYSSGMKQRVKLCSALLCDVPIVFLDEPTSNLDLKGQDLYASLIEQQLPQKTIFLASNEPKEYESFKNRYIIEDKQINLL